MTIPVIERLSPHWSSRGGRVVSAIVLHDTRGATAEGAVAWFQDPASRVSAHYVVGRDGVIYHCVPDAVAAWHAGSSVLHGEPNLNDYSIGIEVVQLQDGDGYPIAQLDSLIALAASIVREGRIPLNRVVGHDQIAMPRGRKTDPGPDFPWYTFLASVGQLL